MAYRMEPRDRDRRGVPWWMWLLALIALALLGWLLFALMFDGDDDDVTATTDATEEAVDTDAPATGGTGDEPLTDIGLLVGSGGPDLVGRRVQLESVVVQSVPGDVTFWVGPSEEEQVLAVLQEEAGAGGEQVEGAVDINPGQQLTLMGVVRQLPPLDQAREQFELDEASLQNEQVYIEVQQVQGAGQ